MATRWALMDRKQFGRDGYLFLRGLQVLRTPWLGIYVHDILGPDADADPHDHPWFMISIILGRKAWYLERLWDARGSQNVSRDRMHSGWRPRMVLRSQAHQILATPDTRPLRTLAIVGPSRPSWSFWLADGTRQPWDEYLRERGKL